MSNKNEVKMTREEIEMDVIEEVVAKHGGIVATVHYKAVEE